MLITPNAFKIEEIKTKSKKIGAMYLIIILNSAFIFIPCILNSAWTMADAQWILVEWINDPVLQIKEQSLRGGG